MKIIIIKTKIIAGAFVLFTLCLFLLLTRTSTFYPHKLYEVGIVAISVLQMRKLRQWRLSFLPKDMWLACGAAGIQSQASLFPGSRFSTIKVVLVVFQN